MDIKNRKSILSHLASKAADDSIALQAIQKESTKIAEILQNAAQYDIIVDQLELLDVIAYRVYDEAIGVIRVLLGRLEQLELTYQEIPGYPVEYYREYQNNFTLMVKAIEVLEHIRYHNPEEALNVFFEYSCHGETSVAEKAKEGIKEFSKLNLDIFYGDGKDWHGLGWQPQEMVIEKIASFDEETKQRYFLAIIVACEQVLSPTITGTTSTYKTVTWRSGAVPAVEGIKEVRKRTLGELQVLYSIARTVEQQTAVLNAMETATQTPHMGDYGDDVQEMIVENSIMLITFLKSLTGTNNMQIMQKIEHDAYWLLYRIGDIDKEVRKLSLEIRDALYADQEYQKYRILIGYESIFHDWKKGGKESEDFEQERTYREEEVKKFAESINSENYLEWKERIINYASIKSNDLAMFPYFGKFLELFGKSSPKLALQLLSEASEQLENFIVAILCGIAETYCKGLVYSLIEDWCEKGKYLVSLARFFEFSKEMNEELLKKIMVKAEDENDLHTLNQLISSVAAQYSEANHNLLNSIMIPSLSILTKHKNSDWISHFWFRKQLDSILDGMEDAEQEVILENLYWINEVDYHAEEILFGIAKRSPGLVIQYFCNRLSKEKEEDDKRRYSAIPFSFYKLSEPLSQQPVEAINAVLDTYDGNYGLFIYRGAQLLKNIFPDFPEEFQNRLIEIIVSKEEGDLLFVMAILRNYEGKSVVQRVCKELIKVLPEDSKLLNEIRVILQSTGVVSGEYGFVEAYKQKLEEIKPWLKDEDSRIRDFAENYIEILEKSIEHEKKRADEDIALGKHQYGTDED